MTPFPVAAQIYNVSGEMKVTASSFDGNSAAYGGGIRSNSTLTVTLSMFEANSADFGGSIPG